MHNTLKKVCLVLLLGLVASSSLYAADLNAGKERSAFCAGCHGPAGISSNPLWPNLAGQSAAYIESQLSKFKSGARENPMMKQVAAGLSDTDIQNLAAYFSSLPAKAEPGDTGLANQGKQKANMCMGCHGQNLHGQAIIPRLASQHPQYLASQLEAFKISVRKEGHMNAVAKSLSADDIKEISAYIGSLQ